MKIVFTTSGENLDAPLDPRFGRARGFLLYDTETGQYEIVDNEQNLNAAQGAGIQAAETVSRLGAGALITGHCGPKAFRALMAGGIQIYNTDVATIAAALEEFQAGRLMSANAADVEGHWA
ncbi:dinitrogenase iron-molybdenum cofactor biosynthesis protein [bacterium]|nr:dinitrogenase iron-molybdenum cofactor biosynthesis protein [bacterium]